MKYEIRGTKPGGTLTFWLETNSDGAVILHCSPHPEDPSDDWCVVGITPDGFLKRYGCLSDGLGLMLNPDDETIMLKDEAF